VFHPGRSFGALSCRRSRQVGRQFDDVASFEATTVVNVLVAPTLA
jgi:hypothetical protein